MPNRKTEGSLQAHSPQSQVASKCTPRSNRSFELNPGCRVNHSRCSQRDGSIGGAGDWRKSGWHSSFFIAFGISPPSSSAVFPHREHIAARIFPTSSASGRSKLCLGVVTAARGVGKTRKLGLRSNNARPPSCDASLISNLRSDCSALKRRKVYSPKAI